MPKYVVDTVDEIAPGSKKIVEVGGRSIGVFNVNGQYFAILNRCPEPLRNSWTPWGALNSVESRS